MQHGRELVAFYDNFCVVFDEDVLDFADVILILVEEEKFPFAFDDLRLVVDRSGVFCRSLFLEGNFHKGLAGWRQGIVNVEADGDGQGDREDGEAGDEPEMRGSLLSVGFVARKSKKNILNT